MAKQTCHFELLWFLLQVVNVILSMWITTSQQTFNANIVNQLRSWIFVLLWEKGKQPTSKKRANPGIVSSNEPST